MRREAYRYTKYKLTKKDILIVTYIHTVVADLTRSTELHMYACKT